MSKTVSGHQQAIFANPQNGQSPIDADQVTANDNALRVLFNAHDADSGIHVQSSLYADRPVAGTAGRLWMASDRLTFGYDDGTDWYSLDYLHLSLGGTVNGNVTFAGDLIGALTGNADTATTLATARTITVDGVLSGSVSFDGSANVTLTAALVAGSIVNADINGSAGIVDTKLATIATAGKVSNSATTATNANTASTIVARDASGNFAAGRITASALTLNGVAYTLPATDGGAGEVLHTDGAGTLSWAAGASGYVTGSGTVGTLAKFSTTSALANSIFSESGAVGTVAGALVATGAYLAVGTSPATTGVIRLPLGTSIYGGTSNYQIIGLDGSGYVVVGNSTNNLKLGASALLWPAVDGSTGQVLKTDGAGTLSWYTLPGALSGLTTNKLPKAGSSSTLVDSILSEASSILTVTGSLTVTTDLVVTGATTMTGDLSTRGNTYLGNDSGDVLTIAGAIDSDILLTSGHTLGTSSAPIGKIYLLSSSGGGVFVAGTKVVGARSTGWTTPTGTASKAAGNVDGYGGTGGNSDWASSGYSMFDTLRNDVRTLGGFVKALFDAASTHGLIGA